MEVENAPSFGKARINFHPAMSRSLSSPTCACALQVIPKSSSKSRYKIRTGLTGLMTKMMKTKTWFGYSHIQCTCITCTYIWLAIWKSLFSYIWSNLWISIDRVLTFSRLLPGRFCSATLAHLRLCLQLCKTCCIMRLGPGVAMETKLLGGQVPRWVRKNRVPVHPMQLGHPKPPGWWCGSKDSKESRMWEGSAVAMIAIIARLWHGVH